MANTQYSIYSLLAIDSYNHGYGQWVSGLGGDGAWIGSAEIIKQSELSTATIDSAEEAASFYAVAYDVNGQTVISFRGTDDFDIDILNGYGVGVGYPGAVQALMAIKFYKEVVAEKLTASGISVTADTLTAEQLQRICAIQSEAMPKYALPSKPNSTHVPELLRRSHPSGFW